MKKRPMEINFRWTFIFILESMEYNINIKLDEFQHYVFNIKTDFFLQPIS